jgi:beta-glucosidase
MAANEINQRVSELLAQMTLEEKISLLSGKDSWQTVSIERLHIPSITMTDGPHGVRAMRVGPERKQGPTTSFPTGITMAATWNVELVEKVGQALGDETHAMDCDILLGPCVNIVRQPLGGRNFETYSEDPFLAGKTAVAWIKGLQSRGVGASLKHYAVNNYEIERSRASSNLDERTLREIYLPHFEMAVREAQPWTVMCSYNRVNGVYASQNDTLLNRILKDEWGFEGAVISDWGANHTIFESIQGGLDLEMPGPAKYYHFLKEAVANWQIDEAEIDDAASRVLRLVLLSGRMDGEVHAGSVNTSEHQTLARQVAEEAITLLKNEGGILPINNKAMKIAVIGPNAAEAVIQGGGSSHVTPYHRVTPLEALKNMLDGKVEVLYEQGCENQAGRSMEDGIQRAVIAARLAEIALVFVGYPEAYETEGTDRPDMQLTGKQDALVSAVAEANPRTVVIVNAGAPVSMPWVHKVSALVMAYYPGQENGSAIANVLLGKVNPSGKLPITLMERLEDSPAFINMAYPGCRGVNYGEGIFVGYRYFDKVDRQPLFAFGHGLSYTQFEYSELRLPSKVKPGEPLKVSLIIKNTGSVAGKEVVQLYVADPIASLLRPPKELKGFAKLELEPGQSQEVSFSLDMRALSFYDPYRRSWVAEPGEFQVLVGSSSRDIRLKGSFTLG